MNQSSIADLETAAQSEPDGQRAATLRRVTDLFLVHADGFSDQQIDVFDDVLVHLITKVESNALAELGGRPAPIENAPRDVKHP